MIAEGGTERGHGISIARGDSPEGPFEAAPRNPLVSARSTDRPDAEHRPRRPRRRPRRRVARRAARRAAAQHDARVLGARARDVRHARAVAGRRLARDRPGRARPAARHAVRRRLRPTPSSTAEWVAVRRAAARARRPHRAARAGSCCTATARRSTTRGRCSSGAGRSTSRNPSTARVDVSAGVGGLAVRYDERFHVERRGRRRLGHRAAPSSAGSAGVDASRSSGAECSDSAIRHPARRSAHRRASRARAT